MLPCREEILPHTPHCGSSCEPFGPFKSNGCFVQASRRTKMREPCRRACLRTAEDDDPGTMWKVFLSAAAAIGLARGQGIPAADDAFPVPPRPAFQIIDDARIFQHEPDRLRALADHLGDLRETHAFPLYLVIHDSLIGTSASEQVQRLHDAWIGDGS